MPNTIIIIGWALLFYIQECFRKQLENITNKATQPFTPKVVLFDMDGVLYDSMPNHAKAWQRAMAEFGTISLQKTRMQQKGHEG